MLPLRVSSISPVSSKSFTKLDIVNKRPCYLKGIKLLVSFRMVKRVQRLKIIRVLYHMVVLKIFLESGRCGKLFIVPNLSIQYQSQTYMGKLWEFSLEHYPISRPSSPSNNPQLSAEKHRMVNLWTETSYVSSTVYCTTG